MMFLSLIPRQNAPAFDVRPALIVTASPPPGWLLVDLAMM